VECISFILRGQKWGFAFALCQAIPAGELQGDLRKILPEQRSGGRFREVKDRETKGHLVTILKGF